MYFTEFLALMLGAIGVVWLLLIAVEKIICKLGWMGTNPIIRFISALILVYSLLFGAIHYFLTSFQMNYFWVAGVAIILNKYWLGHFGIGRQEIGVSTEEEVKGVVQKI